MLAEAATGGGPVQLWVAGIGGFASLAAALFVAWFAFRGNARNVDNDRDKRYDERVDKENERLRGENERLRGERDAGREEILRLRLLCRAEGIDPDRRERPDAGG